MRSTHCRCVWGWRFFSVFCVHFSKYDFQHPPRFSLQEGRRNSDQGLKAYYPGFEFATPLKELSTNACMHDFPQDHCRIELTTSPRNLGRKLRQHNWHMATSSLAYQILLLGSPCFWPCIPPAYQILLLGSPCFWPWGYIQSSNSI